MPAPSASRAPAFVKNRRRLLVVERGASLLANEEAESGAENFDETVTLAQVRDESPDEFSDRVVRRIAAAAHSAPFSQALLYASNACEQSTVSARRLIALAISAHAETATCPAELVVVADADASRDERERLLELTDDLVLGTEGTSLPVRLRFVAATAQAGTVVPARGAELEQAPALPLRRVRPRPADPESARHG